MLPRTRLSLFYVAGYLISTGLGLMIAPLSVLRLLFSTGHYDGVFVRFTGVLMLALGILVVQVVRLRIAALYPGTVVVRAVIWLFVLFLYTQTKDPFFLIVLAVVGLGMIVTSACYFSERRRAA